MFPARCVMGSFKPTFFKRDAPSHRGSQASRSPFEVDWKLEAAKRCGGDPPAIRAGFKRAHTARAGYIERLELGRGLMTAASFRPKKRE